jgi:RND family efflux transporter MFP subunit
MSTETQETEGNGDGQATTEHASRGRVSPHASAGTGRTLLWAVCILAIVLVVAFAIAYAAHRNTEQQADQLADQTADAKPDVLVVAARTSAASYPLTLPGQTAGWYQSTIFARVDGFVGSWSSDIGDRVKQNQVLALIETPELDQQLNAAKSKVATAEAQVKVAEANLAFAKVTRDRWVGSPKGSVSEQEVDDKKAAYDESAASLTAALALAKSAEAEVDRLLALEQFKQVTAPYDGVITSRKIDVGDLVSAGSTSNTTSLYGIAQSNVIRVFVDVPQKAAAQMVVGLPADITSDQYPGRIFHGKVARSAMSIDPQTRTQRTEVDIPNRDMAIVPGMYVQVAFQLSQSGLQEVPAAAIMFVPGGLQVAVVDNDNTIHFRAIKVAKDNGDVVVLESGVNPGDKVALNLSSAVTNGQEVNPQLDTSNDVWPAANPQTAPVEPSNPPVNGASPASYVPAPDSGTNPPAPAKAPENVPSDSNPQN